MTVKESVILRHFDIYFMRGVYERKGLTNKVIDYSSNVLLNEFNFSDFKFINSFRKK